MKVRSAIKALCKDCYIVRRGKTRFVYCKTTPKHKQRQGFHSSAHSEAGAQQQFCALCAPARDFSKTLNFANLRIGGMSIASMGTAAAEVSSVPLAGLKAAGGVWGAIAPVVLK